MCVYGIFKLDTKENFIAHRWKNIRKGSEYAYIEYVNCTDRKISEKGSGYAYIEYLNWTQKRILCHTLREKYQRVTNMRIEYVNWITGTKFYVVH